jgi:DNA helicase II / ATP-dependent DNA helicase PcrA
VSLIDAARLIARDGGLPARARGTLGALVADFDRWHAQVREGADHVALAEAILDESGYTAMWQNEKSPDAQGRLENLKELVKALDAFDNLQGFLEHVALVMDNETEEAAEKVSIMTLHAAKGLEFPCVFLPGWEDGLFPVPARDGRERAEGPRGGAPPRLCRHHPRPAALHHLLRRQPAHLQPVAVGDAVALRRRAARGPCRGPDAARPLRRRLRHGGAVHAGRHRRARRRLQLPGLAPHGVRATERGVGSPRESRTMTIDATAISPYEPGARVFHQKFGYGTVDAVEGDKLSVAFDKAGTKHVVSRFVTAAEDIPF